MIEAVKGLTSEYMEFSANCRMDGRYGMTIVDQSDY
jgi:hypothetical protein